MGAAHGLKKGKVSAHLPRTKTDGGVILDLAGD
jgi:hypothetical protein